MNESQFALLEPSISALLIPVFGHLCLIQFLFLMVSYQRWMATRHDGVDYSDLAWKGREPERSRRWAKNLDNQFQLPLLFYSIVAFIWIRTTLADGGTGVPLAQIVLAWLFLFGRMAHTFVQVTTDNVPWRGYIFTINWAALTLMWLLFFFNIWMTA